MIITDKKIIEEGTKIFNSITAFIFACSDYFKYKNKGFDDEAIQDFLDLSKPQITFLSALWDNPKYSELYKRYPWVAFLQSDIQNIVKR